MLKKELWQESAFSACESQEKSLQANIWYFWWGGGGQTQWSPFSHFLFLVGSAILFSDFSYIRLNTNSRWDNHFHVGLSIFQNHICIQTSWGLTGSSISRMHYVSCLRSGLNSFKGQKEYLLKFKSGQGRAVWVYTPHFLWILSCWIPKGKRSNKSSSCFTKFSSFAFSNQIKSKSLFSFLSWYNSVFYDEHT